MYGNLECSSNKQLSGQPGEYSLNKCLVAACSGVMSGCQTNLSNSEVRHPRCVGSTTKNFCVLHNRVKHNYISSSSTLGLQLHVSALYVGHLQVLA